MVDKMKKFFSSSMWKDTLRTIKNSFTRYLAIIAMTGLSAMIFIGLQSGVPNLKKLIVDRAESHNMHDFRLTSYTGIREKDKEIIDSIPGLKDVEYISEDSFPVTDSDYTIKIISKTESIDHNVVLEGRLPEKIDEIALDYKHFTDHGNNLGKKISFDNKEESVGKPMLNNTEFTIVGYVNSVEYIAASRMNSSNSGSYFATVMPEAITKRYPDYAVMTLSSNDGLDISSNKYKLQETEKLEEIGKLFDHRPEEVKAEIIADANSDIADAKLELENGKDEIEKGKQKLLDAKSQLDEAKNKLEDGKEELDKGKIELDDGKAQLADARIEIDKGQEELDNSKKILDDSKLQLGQGRDELDQGQREYDKNKAYVDSLFEDYHVQIAQGQEEIDKAKETLASKEALYEENLAKVENGQEEIEKNKALIEDGYRQLDIEYNNLVDKKAQLENKLEELQAQKERLEVSLRLVNLGIDTIENGIPDWITPEIAEALHLQDLIEAYLKLDELLEQKAKIEDGLAQINDGIRQIEDGLAQIKDGFGLIEDNRKNLDEKKSLLESEEAKLIEAKPQLEEAKKQLDAGKAEIDKNQNLLDEKKAELANKENEAYRPLNEAKAKLDKGEEEYQASLKKYEEGFDKYKAGEAKLNDAKNEYELGQDKINKAQAKYDNGLFELNKGYAEYNKGLKEYEDGKKTFEEESTRAERKINEAEYDIQHLEGKLANLTVPMYNLQGKYGNIAFYGFIDQSNSLNYMSYIFSFLFYLVAILVTMTTVLRMVETERTQIGTLKALGYSKNTIMRKYMGYGLSATLIGSLIGIATGYYILMPPIMEAYCASTNLTGNPKVFEADKALMILAISLVLIGFTIYKTVNDSLKENAASLMRPKPPTEAKKTLIEKIGFIWNNLSFLNKVTMRNLFRNKLRMAMTIIGVAGSFGLIAMGFGIQTSINNVAPRQFGDIYKFDAQVIYNDQADDKADLDKYIEDKKTDSMAVISQFGTIKTPEGFNDEMSITASDDNESLAKFITLRNRSSHENYQLEDGKVIISEKIAKIQGLKVSDMLVFKDVSGVEHSLEISAITEQYFNHAIYMTKKTYNEVINPNQNDNSYLIKLKDTSEESIGILRAEISEFDSCFSFIPIIDLRGALNDLSYSLKPVILLVIFVSATLALVVLYNLTNINISERIREISTIKVLGFRPNEVMSYIFKENTFLTLLGMFFGYFTAKLMHGIIVHYLSPGAFQFDPQMMTSNFTWTIFLTITFTLIVMLLSKRDMDKIDMVEALKATE